MQVMTPSFLATALARVLKVMVAFLAKGQLGNVASSAKSAIATAELLSIALKDGGHLLTIFEELASVASRRNNAAPGDLVFWVEMAQEEVARLTPSLPKGQTLWRVVRPEEVTSIEVGGDVVAKDPSATLKVSTMVSHGSRIDGQFVPMTKSILSAHKWAAKTKRDVIAFDRNFLIGEVYDLTDEAVRAEHLTGAGWSANTFSKSSFELLLEGRIPNAAITILPRKWEKSAYL